LNIKWHRILNFIWGVSLSMATPTSDACDATLVAALTELSERQRERALERYGLVVTTVPKVTLRNTFYINELFGAFCYKQYQRGGEGRQVCRDRRFRGKAAAVHLRPTIGRVGWISVAPDLPGLTCPCCKSGHSLRKP
jgi:hypothetical protein